jgi:hypothetical protein
VAFWVVRRNSDGPTGNSQFTPIAVLIRPDQDCIMGRMSGMQQWVPYPELLRRLTSQVRGDELKYADQQKSQVAHFVRQLLYGLRNQPTLVLTHAQNARQSWDWLKNGQIISDKIQLADLPIQDLALYGWKLRMARVRDGERAETAQWWAPASNEIAGFSVGLWEVGEDPQGDPGVLLDQRQGQHSHRQAARRHEADPPHEERQARYQPEAKRLEPDPAGDHGRGMHSRGRSGRLGDVRPSAAVRR